MKLAQLNLNEVQSQAIPGFAFEGSPNLGTLIGKIIPYLLTVAGILLLLFLLFGGLQLMLSRGDPKSMEGAKGKISNALVGFLIVFVAYWLTQIIGSILGLQQTTFGQLFNLR